MRRILLCLLSFAALAVPTTSWEASISSNLGIAVTASQAIAAVGLSNSSFTGGSPAGTVVGAISVTMSPAAPAFSGTLSLSGTNASSFQIVGASLQTKGVVAAGAYRINLVATQAGAGGSPFTQAVAITGTPPLVPSASACPRGTGYPDDGCAGAQSAGRIQITNFFTSYTGKDYSSNRPPWNVAGVDYPIGYAGTPVDGTIAGNRPACLTFSSRSGFTATASSSDCTVSGIDFGGYCVFAAVSGGHTVTFSNDFFWHSTAHCNPEGGALLNSSGGTGNVIIKYSVFDGSQVRNNNTCAGGCPSELLLSSNNGNLTVQYSAFLMANQHSIQFNHAGNFVAQFNFIEGIGLAPSHGDWIISNNGNGSQVINEDHNVGHSTPANSSATAFCYITNTNNSSARVSGWCRNDTWINRLGGVSFPIEVNPGGIVDALNISNNYLDFSGGVGAMYLPTQTGSVLNGPVTCTGNKNMTTGATITGVVSSFGAGWVCR